MQTTTSAADEVADLEKKLARLADLADENQVAIPSKSSIISCVCLRNMFKRFQNASRSIGFVPGSRLRMHSSSNISRSVSSSSHGFFPFDFAVFLRRGRLFYDIRR